jgi:hypothetical protein
MSRIFIYLYFMLLCSTQRPAQGCAVPVATYQILDSACRGLRRSKTRTGTTILLTRTRHTLRLNCIHNKLEI